MTEKELSERILSLPNEIYISFTTDREEQRYENGSYIRPVPEHEYLVHLAINTDKDFEDISKDIDKALQELDKKMAILHHESEHPDFWERTKAKIKMKKWGLNFSND